MLQTTGLLERLKLKIFEIGTERASWSMQDRGYYSTGCGSALQQNKWQQCHKTNYILSIKLLSRRLPAFGSQADSSHEEAARNSILQFKVKLIVLGS
jgi:hypothetical protein